MTDEPKKFTTEELGTILYNEKLNIAFQDAIRAMRQTGSPEELINVLNAHYQYRFSVRPPPPEPKKEESPVREIEKPDKAP